MQTRARANAKRTAYTYSTSTGKPVRHRTAYSTTASMHSMRSSRNTLQYYYLCSLGNGTDKVLFVQITDHA